MSSHAKKGRKRHRKRERQRSLVATTKTGNKKIVAKHTPSSEAISAYVGALLRDPRFKIHYLIPHEPQDFADASPLGWYTPGLHEAARPLIYACTLPADIREPYSEPGDVLPLRLVRGIWPRIIPIQTDALEEAQALLPSPFRVYITTKEAVADAVDAIGKNSPVPYLHASTVPGPNRLEAHKLNRDSIIRYVRRVLNILQRIPEWTLFVEEARKAISEEEHWVIRKHPLPTGSHNVVTPNETSLCAFGWKLIRNDPIVKKAQRPPQRSDYVDRICRSADAVFTERKRLMGRRLSLIDYRYVLAVPSMYWDHYTHWRERLQRLAEYEGSVPVSAKLQQLARMVYLAAIRQKSYPVQYELRETAAVQVIAELNKELANDMRSFTSGLAYLSSASLAPVLRLEPQLNEIRPDLRLIASFIRSPGNHHQDWKRSRLYRQLGAKMRTLIATEFLDRIDRIDNDVPIEGMKLVSDLPLEWLPTNGLPLSMRFDVSRIPVLPGNMYIANCIMPPVMVPLDKFSEVLVIRSFEADDPVRGMLENRICEDPTISSMVRFQDVENQDELIDAL